MQVKVVRGVQLGALAIGMAIPAASQGAPVVRSAAGVTAADIQAVLDQFRDDLGPLNANEPGSRGSGRREINWDGVPDAFSSPNIFPGDFFNANTAPRARGAVFQTPGPGFEVSADDNNPAASPVRFGNLQVDYPSDFSAFSPQRLFIAQDSTITDVLFFIPGSNVPATVSGFGAVFTDVDLPDTTSIQYFDAADNLLHTQPVPVSGATDGGFSFAGVSFDAGEQVARVRITSGNVPLGPTAPDLDGIGANFDPVAMDDFIYGEPVPEPAALSLLAGAALLSLRRRR